MHRACDSSSMDKSETHEGGCLCGSVRYRVVGPLRDVITCHCGECRQMHGGAAPYSACETVALELLSDLGLTWFRSPASTTNADRAFCSLCGSSLFWRAPDRSTTAIAAGTVDEPSGLTSSGHIWWDARADWEVPDGLPTA